MARPRPRVFLQKALAPRVGAARAYVKSPRLTLKLEKSPREKNFFDGISNPLGGFLTSEPFHPIETTIVVNCVHLSRALAKYFLQKIKFTLQNFRQALVCLEFSKKPSRARACEGFSSPREGLEGIPRVGFTNPSRTTSLEWDQLYLALNKTVK